MGTYGEAPVVENKKKMQVMTIFDSFSLHPLMCNTIKE